MIEASWFVLTVVPGRERAAATAVRRAGAEVFLPGERRMVQENRRRRGQKRKTTRVYVSLPGYLFVGMPAWLLNGHGWNAVLDLDLVSGVIMHTRAVGDGPARVWVREPLRLSPAWRLGRWLIGREDVAVLDAMAAQEWTLEVGDQVQAAHAAFVQHAGKIIELRTTQGRAMARVLMTFFGAERVVSVPVDELVLAGESLAAE